MHIIDFIIVSRSLMNINKVVISYNINYLYKAIIF